VDLDDLVASQAGMVARRQLRAVGIDADRVRDQVAAGRWVVRTPRVVSSVTGHLTQEQRQWMAVLHAGPRALLANLSAAETYGLTGWEREYVSVMVDDELSFEPVPGVNFFRSRRAFDLLASDRPGIPRTRFEPAILLWAAYEAPHPRIEQGLVLAALQQRLTTPSRLIEWIDLLHPLRHARMFRRTVSLAEGGVHSGAEREVARMCRRFGIPQPDRQVRRVDRGGRVRWTDAEWRLARGRVVVLEVDGAYHLDVAQAGADAKRARRLTTPTRVIVRATAYEVIHEPHEVAVDLIALGVPSRRGAGRVPDDAA
jgi:hypothetical protein